MSILFNASPSGYLKTISALQNTLFDSIKKNCYYFMTIIYTCYLFTVIPAFKIELNSFWCQLSIFNFRELKYFQFKLFAFIFPVYNDTMIQPHSYNIVIVFKFWLYILVLSIFFFRVLSKYTNNYYNC